MLHRSGLRSVSPQPMAPDAYCTAAHCGSFPNQQMSPVCDACWMLYRNIAVHFPADRFHYSITPDVCCAAVLCNAFTLHYTPLEPFSGVEIHMEMDMEWKWKRDTICENVTGWFGFGGRLSTCNSGGSRGVTWVMTPSLGTGAPQACQGHHRNARSTTGLSGAPVIPGLFTTW